MACAVAWIAAILYSVTSGGLLALLLFGRDKRRHQLAQAKRELQHTKRLNASYRDAIDTLYRRERERLAQEIEREAE